MYLYVCLCFVIEYVHVFVCFMRDYVCMYLCVWMCLVRDRVYASKYV